MDQKLAAKEQERQMIRVVLWKVLRGFSEWLINICWYKDVHFLIDTLYRFNVWCETRHVNALKRWHKMTRRDK